MIRAIRRFLHRHGFLPDFITFDGFCAHVPHYQRKCWNQCNICKDYEKTVQIQRTRDMVDL